MCVCVCVCMYFCLVNNVYTWLKIIAKHIFKFIFILAVLSLCCHMWASSGCGQWGYSPAVVLGASFCSGFSCYRAQSLGDMGFSSCGSCSVIVGHGLSCSQHVSSFPTRNQTFVPYSGKWMFNHWTTRETPQNY